MFLKALFIAICLFLMAHLTRHLFALNARLRETAQDDRRRQLVDWTAPASKRRSKPRSRISKMLDL